MVRSGANVRYVVPARYSPEIENRFYLRPLIVANGAKLIMRCGDVELSRKSLAHIQPSEMIALTVEGATLDAADGEPVEVHIE